MCLPIYKLLFAKFGHVGGMRNTTDDGADTFIYAMMFGQPTTCAFYENGMDYVNDTPMGRAEFDKLVEGLRAKGWRDMTFEELIPYVKW